MGYLSSLIIVSNNKPSVIVQTCLLPDRGDIHSICVVVLEASAEMTVPSHKNQHLPASRSAGEISRSRGAVGSGVGQSGSDCMLLDYSLR